MPEPSFLRPRRRIFSGVQPTGALHLGNYLGAVKNFVALQKNDDCIYCIVDLHAATLPYHPESLRHAVRHVAAAFIACGIDPEQHIIFRQSAVGAHAELAWLFNCVARMGWLNRMTQFKEKAGKQRENASIGLFTYPILMAADILLYQADAVPVGDDQQQHIELTRDIARKFNTDYASEIAALGFGEAFFRLPEAIIPGPTARVMSLRDGTRKMSKSDPSDYSRITLNDDADMIARKINKARTDSTPLPDDPVALADRPEARNLVALYAGLADCTPQDVLRDYGGASFIAFKTALTDLTVTALAPITAELARLTAEPDHLDEILASGAERAANHAAIVLRDTKRIMAMA